MFSFHPSVIFLRGISVEYHFDSNKQEFSSLEEVKSYEKSEDSPYISYEGAEGEGELLLLHSDGPAREYDHDHGLILSHRRNRIVGKLNE